MKKQQSGFSAVEVILSIAVIGLIGAVGWLVIDRQPTKSDNKKAISEQSATEPAPKTPEDTTKYYQIEKWGVKVPLTASTHDLYLDDSGFRTKTLDTIGESGCKSNSILIVRGTAMDRLPMSAGEGPTFAQVYDDNNTSIRAKVGNYYYLTPGYRGASCVTGNISVDDNAKRESEQEARIFSDITEVANKMVAL